MSAVIKRKVRGTIDFDGEHGNVTIGYVFEDHEPGEEILDHPDIPKLDHVYRVQGIDLYATRFGIETFKDSPLENGVVHVTYSREPAGTSGDESYIIWEKGYKKDSLKVPAYVLKPEFYLEAGTGVEKTRWEWTDADYSIPIEYSVLTVTVNRTANGLEFRSKILEDMAIAEGQHDHLHIFPQFPGKQWIMQPHNARQAGVSRVQLTYSWVSDPGNGAPGLPIDPDVAGAYLLPRIERPPLHYYAVIGQQGLINTKSEAKGGAVAPKFSVMPLYPEKLQDNTPNPRYDPNGWKTLAGKPMG